MRNRWIHLREIDSLWHDGPLVTVNVGKYEKDEDFRLEIILHREKTSCCPYETEPEDDAIRYSLTDVMGWVMDAARHGPEELKKKIKKDKKYEDEQ